MSPHETTAWTNEERGFVLAMERYRREAKRPFPTCREVLAVLKSLGYRQVEPAGRLPRARQGKIDGGQSHSDRHDKEAGQPTPSLP